uniref:anaerobic ribonucleoside-triphosphate reductase n=1 Tax=uncultured Treponema sp. TaxID=162155 RepID=UPI00280BB45B
MTEQTKKIEELNAQIEGLKEELRDVHGTETEVYARIVGYYRAVKNWNKGKRDEFHNRKLFTVDETVSDDNASLNCTTAAETDLRQNDYAPLFSTQEQEYSSASEEQTAAELSGYEFFMRKT